MNPQQQKQLIQKAKVKQHGSYKAYLLAALSSTCLTLMQLNFKQLSKHFSPPLILGLRACFSFLVNLLFMGHLKLDLHVRDPVKFRMLIKRAIVSYVTVALYISSIKYIPLGIANALHNTSPIITFFVEVFYYKKSKIHWINLMITLFCFTGILLVVQPEFIFGSSKEDTQNSNQIYYMMVLAAAFLSSFSAIFTHDLSGKVDELVTLQFGYMSQSFCNLLFFMIFIGTSDQTYNFCHNLSLQQMGKLLLNFTLMLVFAMGAQYTRAKAYFMCYPALVMPFNFLTIIFGLLIDILVFDSKKYNITIIIGMALASLGLFSKFIILKFKARQNQEDNPGKLDK